MIFSNSCSWKQGIFFISFIQMCTSDSYWQWSTLVQMMSHMNQWWSISYKFPADSRRKNNIIMTSKRRFDVMIALLLRRVPIGLPCIVTGSSLVNIVSARLANSPSLVTWIQSNEIHYSWSLGDSTMVTIFYVYCEASNISRPKPHNLNVSRIVLVMPLPNPLKAGVKSRMKM